MKRRLFWKIAVCFFLTFLAMLQALWLTLLPRANEQPPVPMRVQAEQLGPLVLSTSTDTIARLGAGGMTALLERLPDETAKRLEVTAGGEFFHPAEVQGDRKLVAKATAPDGQAFQLTYYFRTDRGAGSTIMRAPPPFILIGLIGALLFSAVLAWYLTAPINRLRDAFDRLAKGDLEVRVAAAIGSRRDEIADLGRDFDLMAQRIKQLVHGRERLLHDVSHELRSPLARIRLAIGLARQDASRTEFSLARVEREAQRLDELVGELITLARVENGRVTERHYFDLAGVVGSVAEDARFEAYSSDVRVALIEDLPPEDARALIQGDPELVQQALENIVRNALRFSAGGQTVELRIAYDPRQRSYRIEIADNGPGVAPDELETLFDPFVRGEDEGAGLGLGLSIAARAITAHGGTISAANRAAGGLSVTITLPGVAPAQNL